MSIFGGPAWHLDAASGQYYLHNFEAAQPDLNWWNEDVRREFDDIIRFWWDRGVAGFRIDVCNMMIKDKDLRDNPPASEDDPLDQQFMGVRAVFNTDRPEAHDILRRWRAIADTYDPERLLIGETNVEQLPTLMQFYGAGRDELHGGFNFVFINAPLEAEALRAVVEGTEALIPHEAWPIWTASNHDVSRLSTRWAGGDPAKIKVALLILLTLRGTPFLYQGDEIGLTDGPIQRADVLDSVGTRFWPYYKGRDAERTPMPWSGGPGGGFSEPGVRTWLPMADPAACNVADQEDDPDSVLELCRRVIVARAASDDLAVGPYRSLPSPEGTWAFERGGAPPCCSTCPMRWPCSTACAARWPWPPSVRSRGRGSRATSRWRPGAVSSWPGDRRRRSPVRRGGGAAAGAAALPALHDAGPGAHGTAADAGRSAGRRGARRGVLHHVALPPQGGGDRRRVRALRGRVRRPRPDGGQPRARVVVQAGRAGSQG